MDNSEQESLEALRLWWSKFGKLIISAVVIAALAYSGYSFWVWQKNQQKMRASEAYSMLIRHAQEQDDEAFVVSAERIIQQYPKLPYADLSSLLLAEKYTKNQQWGNAIQVLERVNQASSISPLADIARIRIARIYLSQKQYDSALVVLDRVSTSTFETLALELKGDIYRFQDKNDQAIASYKKALTSDPIARELRETFIAIKLGDLGVDASALETPIQ